MTSLVDLTTMVSCHSSICFVSIVYVYRSQGIAYAFFQWSVMEDYRFRPLADLLIWKSRCYYRYSLSTVPYLCTTHISCLACTISKSGLLAYIGLLIFRSAIMKKCRFRAQGGRMRPEMTSSLDRRLRFAFCQHMPSILNRCVERAFLNC
jgi:hypothetical protein